MRTRIKICGITRCEDATAAADAGADAIGLVFYPKSPRCVDVQQAGRICAVLPPFVSVVALFVDPERESVAEVLNTLPVDVLQFHGDEPAALCESFDRPYIKAIGMQADVNSMERMRAHPGARAFLLDTLQPQRHGGGGTCFDWQLVPAERPAPLILAGGLKPENVASAVQQIAPYAVDVSSGVESAKGIKSASRIEAFIREVERGDTSRQHK